MPLQQTSLWYCAAITAAESARLIATEVGLDGAFLPPRHSGKPTCCNWNTWWGRVGQFRSPQKI